MRCCKRKSEQPPKPRTIHFGGPNPTEKFKSNKIRTTKYKAWNFLPYSIILQFRRPSNVFFLIVAILQCISIISALSPVASVAPFIIVIGVSVLRQGFEDYKRYKNDKQTNLQKTLRLRNQQFEECRWQDLHVGDFVKLIHDDIVPADILLMYSSEQNGVAYVETANLDGERNLKNKNAFSDDIRLYPTEFQRLRGQLTIDGPNPNLHDFNGVIKMQNQQQKALSDLNLLLRGTKLKNTMEAVGIVVYAGMDTKIFLNQSEVRHKVSAVQRKVNVIQLILFIILFLMCLAAALMYYRVWKQYESRDNIFYLRNKYHYSIGKDAGLISLTVFLLISFLIPISMNISMEILKTAQGDLISKDLEMSYLIDGERKYCKVINTSIIEELGCVEYVLTDKTGTLTSNTMEFKNAWVQGKDFSADQMLQEKYRLLKDENFVRFWTAVVLCHDVVVDTRSNEYQGSSADQVCFLDYAKFLGFIFRKRTKISVEVEIFNQKRVYQLLMVCPFSQRKMMTVVVRDIQARCVVVLTKGADTAVLACKSPNQHPQKIASANQALDKFSKLGLRTLVFGLRVIPDEQFNRLNLQHSTIKSQKSVGTITKQQEKERSRLVLSKLQSNLTIIGVSAIEDKLQDGVPECIQRLQEAGIKVVMITGDKLETAENIGYLSNFIHEGSQVYRIKDQSPDVRGEVSQIRQRMGNTGQDSIDITVLIEGRAIGDIISAKDPTYLKLFEQMVSKCKSLIFCRSTPAQKGSIVKFFKDRFGKTVLGIGDGGNDVNMIQQADVGVGILGKEGNQAASASDFFFCQFRFLDRLLLHHGRWAYYRIAYFFVYYGFKNILVTLFLYYYLAYCGWSGTNILSSSYLTVYNSLLSVFMTIYYGVFQQDINADMYTPAWASMPAFYKQYKKIQLFSYFRYFLWSAAAVALAFWMFFNTIYGLSAINAVDSVGRVADFRFVSSNLSISVFLVITVVAYIDMYNFTIVTWFTIWILTILVAVIYYLIENFVNIGPNYRVYGDSFRLKYWLVILINVWTAYGLRIAYTTFRFNYMATNVMKWMIKRNRDYRTLGKSHNAQTNGSINRIQLQNGAPSPLNTQSYPSYPSVPMKQTVSYMPTAPGSSTHMYRNGQNSLMDTEGRLYVN